MKTKVLFIILIGMLFQNSYGQLSEGGTPISFSLSFKELIEKTPVMELPAVDVKALLEEDELLRKEEVQRPFRFGKAINVDFDIKKNGMKKELSNGDKLWFLKIHCPDAFSINLIYDNFKLADGSKFFIYNEEKTMILGAFTPELSNNRSNVFATDLVQGNTIILEYFEPKSSNDGVIQINKVIHGYVDVFASSGLGTSASCNYDVNCSQGANWTNEKKAVAMILVDDNTGFCSGCLVNNTNHDFTPYFLTARHCYFDSNLNNQTKNPATNIFRFQYWKPNCGSGTPSTVKSILGATLLVNNQQTDMAFLLLSQRPFDSWEVFYAGWDRSSNPAQTSTGIHHPKTDVMKISHEQNPVYAQNHPIQGFQLTTWRVDHFEDGTVQPGSSGSPLFNQSTKKIVGQLSTTHAGNSDNTIACANRNANYGRFDLSWPLLSAFLAPGFGASAPQALDGISKPYITGPLNPCSSPTSSYWVVNQPTGSTVTWSASLNLTPQSGITGNTKSFTYLNGGNSWVSATITPTVGSNIPVNKFDIVAGFPTANMYYNSLACNQKYVIEPPYTPGTTNYRWEVTGCSSSDYSLFSIYALTNSITFYNCNPYASDKRYAVAFTINACGESSTPSYVFEYNNGRGYGASISPNPVDDVLNIQIRTEIEYRRANPLPQYLEDILANNASSNPPRTNLTYDVRLYDSNGNAVRQSTTKSLNLQFNVSSLPNGVYFLSIEDGVSEKPSSQRVVVNH